MTQPMIYENKRTDLGPCGQTRLQEHKQEKEKAKRRGQEQD